MTQGVEPRAEPDVGSTLVGTACDDRLPGHFGDDVPTGLGGDDFPSGDKGSDIVDGGDVVDPSRFDDGTFRDDLLAFYDGAAGPGVTRGGRPGVVRFETIAFADVVGAGEAAPGLSAPLDVVRGGDAGGPVEGDTGAPPLFGGDGSAAVVGSLGDPGLVAGATGFGALDYFDDRLGLSIDIGDGRQRVDVASLDLIDFA